ncbi:MAG: ABC transporter permease [Gemmatimonadota bacterium]
MRERAARLRGMLRRMLRANRSVMPNGGADAEMDEELRFHLEMATVRNIDRGMTPQRARREALLRFGGMERTRESAWDVRRCRWLEDAARDAAHAVRLLRRSPGFAVTALLTLALGIGANTSVFSVLDATLLRPLPYAAPSALIAFTPERYDDYLVWTEGARSLAGSGAYTYSIATVNGGAEPTRSWTLAVTSSLLPTLGVAPLIGRGFTPEDDAEGAPRRVLLRHGFWQEQFGGDPSIVGRTIPVNGAPHEVIGVLPAALIFPPPARRADGSMPVTADVWTGIGWLSDLHERGGVHAVGRLADGWTADMAAAELETSANAARSGDATRVGARRVGEAVAAPLRPALLAFAAGSALVLLIACANLGGMLLARLSGRAREMSVRASLGAARGRVARQVLTEGAVLAACGTVAALGVAWLLLRVLLALAPAELARVDGATLDGRVLGATLALGILTTLLIGLLPAWGTLRRQPAAALAGARGSTGDRRGARVQALLITAEVAFAVVLLVAGGLLLRSFTRLASVSPGFDAAALVTADLLLPSDRYATGEDVRQFFAMLEEQVVARPGVRAVSAIDRLPYGPSSSGIGFDIVGRPGAAAAAQPRGLNTAVLPGYFEAAGIPLVQGRDFTHRDDADAPYVVIISRTLSDRYWPGRDPVGARIVAFGEERAIVGVAGDVRHFGPALPVDPLLYLPHAQDVTTRRMMTVVARTDASTDALAASLRAAIRRLDPQLPISNLRAFDSLRSDRTAAQRFNALVVASFALLALVLAAVGIYGVMSFVVVQRTREVGVRLALGATAAVVLRAFLRRALGSVAAGIAIGIIVALSLTRLLQSMLFGIAANDAFTYITVALLVSAFALLAAWLPARRASRVQPGIAMIGE